QAAAVCEGPAEIVYKQNRIEQRGDCRLARLNRVDVEQVNIWSCSDCCPSGDSKIMALLAKPGSSHATQKQRPENQSARKRERGQDASYCHKRDGGPPMSEPDHRPDAEREAKFVKACLQTLEPMFKHADLRHREDQPRQYRQHYKAKHSVCFPG